MNEEPKQSTRGAVNGILVAVLGLASFAGAVVAPTIYIGGIKTDVATNKVEVDNLKSSVMDLKEAIRSVAGDASSAKSDSAANRAYTEWIVNRFGVRPDSVWKDDRLLASTTSLK